MSLASVLRHGTFASVVFVSFLTSAHAASLRESLGSHKALALVVVLLAAAAAAAWLVARKRYWQLAALAVVALLAATFYGSSKLRTKYPHAALSIERLKDSAAILLGTDMRLSKFDPRSMLMVERKTVERAMYPAVDVHFHLESLPSNITPERLIRAMDATNVAKIINMGGTQELFDHFATDWHDRYPDRFVMFMKPDFDAVAKPGSFVPARSPTSSISRTRSRNSRRVCE